MASTTLEASSELRDAIKSEFATKGVVLDEQQTELCAELCRSLACSSSQLLTKWLGFAKANRVDDSISGEALTTALSRFQTFELTLMPYADDDADVVGDVDDAMALEVFTKDTIHQLDRPPGLTRAGINAYEPMHAPELELAAPPPASFPPPSPTKSGQSSFSFHGELPAVDRAAVSAVELNTDGLNPFTSTYRFMADSPLQRLKAYNARMEQLAGEILRVHGLPRPFPCDNYLQDEVVVVGRIVLEETTEGRELALHSVHANTAARAFVSGTSMPYFSFLPGEIVALKGSNPNGNRFLATAVYQPQPLPQPRVTGDRSVARELSIMVAAGPFTPADDLGYEPLQKLLERVRDVQPDLLILMGPVVDNEHPFISSGDIDISYEALFHEQVAEIAHSLEGISTTVVMIPSLRDSHHAHHVYPQPPYAGEPPSVSIEYFPNPAVWWVNGISVGATSVDVLKHLSASLICKANGSDRVDRITRLVQQVTRQQSFYPLVPPAHGVNLDSSHISNTYFHTFTPHLLLFTSDIKYFVKNVDGTVCVNVSRLHKGHFAHISVHVPSIAAGSVAPANESIASYTRVDIVRL